MAKKGLYMGYLIRKASVDELEQIAYLDSECERETYKHIFNKDYLRTLTANTCKDFWYKEFKKNNTDIFVCEENEKIIGIGNVKYTSIVKDNRGTLHMLYLKTTAQGRGIGKKMVEYAYRLLMKEGIYEMEVYCVEGNNRAKGFYEKIGGRFAGYKVCDYTGVKTISNRFIFKNFMLDEKIIHSYSDVSMVNDAIKRDYVLFGMGDYLSEFFEKTMAKKPIYIFDNNISKSFSSIYGIPIVKPFYVDCPIIITCLYEKDIICQLNSMGMTNIIPFIPWHY